jgi:hypothetical protein
MALASCTVGFGGLPTRTGGVGEDAPVQLVLANDTSFVLCSVMMGPSDRRRRTEWLSRGESIAPGQSRAFVMRATSEWDIRTRACSGEVVSQIRGLPVIGPLELAVSTLRPRTETTTPATTAAPWAQ